MSEEFEVVLNKRMKELESQFLEEKEQFDVWRGKKQIRFSEKIPIINGIIQKKGDNDGTYRKSGAA